MNNDKVAIFAPPQRCGTFHGCRDRRRCFSCPNCRRCYTTKHGLYTNSDQRHLQHESKLTLSTRMCHTPDVLELLKTIRACRPIHSAKAVALAEKDE
jgi:hypothetical protein